MARLPALAARLQFSLFALWDSREDRGKFSVDVFTPLD
jgi:hypothetical protein